MERYQKILLGLLVGALITVGGIQIYFSFFLNDHLQSILVNRFNTATDSTYTIDIGEFDLEILGRQLNVRNVQMSTREDSVDFKFQASLDALNVSGIGFLNLLWNRELAFREIEVVNPSIDFTAASQQNDTNHKRRLTDLSQRLSEITLQVLENVSVPRLLIRGLSATYSQPDLPVEPYFSFRDSYILLQNLSIDSTLIKGKHILPAEDITTVFRDIRMKTANELYELSANELHFSSDARQMNIRSVKLTPRLNKNEFAQKAGYETDRFTVAIDEINCRQIDILKLNRGESIEAQNINIAKPDINIYRDKRPPFPPNNQPPLPQQMVRNIPFPLNIDTLSISDGNIRYSERVPKANEAGFITFTDLQANLYPLTNIDEEADKQQPMTLTAETNIMDQAKLQAQFRFPGNTNQQQIKGSLQPMDMTSLNKALVPLAFVRIEDGQILGMNFNMELTDKHASGNVMLRYENLKISLLNKESSEENFGNKLKSLLANTFKVNSSNTGDDPRAGKVDFKRDSTKSVFNYWWKSLLSGLKSSIGL